MSTITLGKRFEAENFVSLRKKVNQLELQQVIMGMASQFKEHNLTENEYLITTTFSVEIINGEQIMDVEVLLPLKEAIKVEAPFVFKDKIRIENALYSKLEEDISQLNSHLEKVNSYIVENRLQPITSAYLIQSKQGSSVGIEVYIGLSPNIL
jgi:hypothetical protein